MNALLTLTRNLAEKFARRNWPEKYADAQAIPDHELFPFLMIGEFCAELLLDAYQKGWDGCAEIWDWELGVNRRFESSNVSDEAHRRMKEYLERCTGI